MHFTSTDTGLCALLTKTREFAFDRSRRIESYRKPSSRAFHCLGFGTDAGTRALVNFPLSSFCELDVYQEKVFLKQIDQVRVYEEKYVFLIRSYHRFKQIHI